MWMGWEGMAEYGFHFTFVLRFCGLVVWLVSEVVGWGCGCNA